jgi:AcrR family transcriptional regulator/DNA-binding MarR family transcriptional regulator
MSTVAVTDSARQGAHVVEMQRRRLLLAIVEVAGERGFEHATVGQTCKRAGVSRRTFYDLFDDRDDCFLAALVLLEERIAREMLPALIEGRWCERIRRALTALLELFDREPAVARLCLLETLKAGPRVIEHRQTALDRLASIVDEGRAEGRTAEPPPLTAQSVVGGALAVIQARLISRQGGDGTQAPLVELVSPLMGMIVLPYLGQAASRKELQRRMPTKTVEVESPDPAEAIVSDPFKDLPIRITFRTVRVLETIGVEPDASNREIGRDAGVSDPGQMSKLLRRLEKSGLIENRGMGQVRGERNAWRLTPHGRGVLHAVGATK